MLAEPHAEAPIGCLAPALGAQVSLRLGDTTPLEADLQEHFDRCLACRLERVAFDRFMAAAEDAS
jgi:hypothetical protein